MARRDIVVIGASRGGLDALCKLAETLPPAFPAAVLAVVHTAPDGPKLLASLVGRRTRLTVRYGDENETIRPGTLTFAPPGRHLVVVKPGLLGLDDGPKVRHARPAVDPLFTSAAAAYGPRVIGIVLTGGDGDGTDGLRAIKAVGGLAIVQSPSDAVDPSMPNSAIAADDPDYVVPLHAMAPLLVSLTR